MALHPGQTSTQTDPEPAGLFGHQPTGTDGGFFVDLHSAAFRVLDADGAEAVGPTVVDVDRSSPTTDAVPGFTGLYAPDITVPGGTVSFGEWTVEWTVVVAPGDAALVRNTHFTVVNPALPIVDGHAQVQDMYDEGVPQALFTPARIKRAVEQASRLFDAYTGRRFGAHLLAIDVDGRGGPIKQFDEPIIGLSAVEFTFTTFNPADLPIEASNLRVYNRHIRQGLLQPDDREDPRVEFLRVESQTYPRGFPLSQQNLQVRGVFGYTDPDGSAFGVVPSLVREAVLRLAISKLQPLYAATGGGGFMGVSGPLMREKTMDQDAYWADGTITGSGAYVGWFTGNPAVDQIISMYRRPPKLGSTGP